jgi:hypothetical protein
VRPLYLREVIRYGVGLGDDFEEVHP